MKNHLQIDFWLASTILAPMLLAISQFFWVGHVLNSTAAALQVLSFLFWIFAFQGMFEQIKDPYPKYAVWGFFLAVYGCLAGNNFGLEGIFIDAFNNLVPDSTVRFNGKVGNAALIAFFLPGALAPLSWLILGVLFVIQKKIPLWLGLVIAVAAVGFPLSRIPRILWLAHLDNALLLFGMVILAFKLYIKNKGNPTQE